MKTIPELIACVRRELSLRIAIYPKRVREFKMKQEVADHEIQCMQAVLEMLSKHDQQQQLFNDETKEKQLPKQAVGLEDLGDGKGMRIVYETQKENNTDTAQS
ncbi:MAG TPA: hypothetical protein VFG51_00215 [Candidatus Saccharimonadia bacterium]|nr:hypothetical protein [Candidatus Saccharimonadia bacterium]